MKRHLFLIAITILLSTQSYSNSKRVDFSTTNLENVLNVSIFQVHFTEINETLEKFLTKNQQILHFRGEPNSNIYVIYLEAGNTKTNLNNLLKNNEITQFEIIRFQQGARKANLFNKRL